MVYVRGSRKEPSIDHFVKKVWFFLHPSYKPNDLVEVRYELICKNNQPFQGQMMMVMIGDFYEEIFVVFIKFGTF